jgi:hypothetical protein
MLHRNVIHDGLGGKEAIGASQAACRALTREALITCGAQKQIRLSIDWRKYGVHTR